MLSITLQAALCSKHSASQCASVDKAAGVASERVLKTIKNGTPKTERPVLDRPLKVRRRHSASNRSLSSPQQPCALVGPHSKQIFPAVNSVEVFISNSASRKYCKEQCYGESSSK